MKTFEGKVVSDKMTLTAVVEVVKLWTHPIYKKTVRRSKKYLAHNAVGAKLGDKVKIKSTRPVSRLKRWEIVEVEQ